MMIVHLLDVIQHLINKNTPRPYGQPHFIYPLRLWILREFES